MRGVVGKNTFHDGTKVYVTDIDKLIPLLKRNIELDEVQYEVLARNFGGVSRCRQNFHLKKVLCKQITLI